jgi:hypothetical protein
VLAASRTPTEPQGELRERVPCPEVKIMVLQSGARGRAGVRRGGRTPISVGLLAAGVFGVFGFAGEAELWDVDVSPHVSPGDVCATGGVVGETDVVADET